MMLVLVLCAMLVLLGLMLVGMMLAIEVTAAAAPALREATARRRWRRQQRHRGFEVIPPNKEPTA